MDYKILGDILAERFGGNDPKIFEIQGQKVVFYDHALGRTKPSDAPNESPYDTPENRAIVADVIANYDALAAEYQSTLDAVAYKAKRAAEYPPMADYLDAIVKGDEAQKQKYIADCLAVKAKYPKT